MIVFLIAMEAFYDGLFSNPSQIIPTSDSSQRWLALTAVSQPPCDCLAFGLMSAFLLYLGYLRDLVMEIWILFNLAI